jgi:hexokinase
MMDIANWLKKHGMDVGSYDAETLLASFLHEMEMGLNGEPSSLAMIPAYVGAHTNVPLNKSVAVIDAGGTNLRVCIAHFNDQGKVELSGFSKQPMPGRAAQVSAQEFYDTVADKLESFHEDFEAIGCCFSYPATIQPDYDGVLLHWTKEIKIPEMVGQPVGAGLVRTLEERGMGRKQVVVLNDTVAALLAGMGEGQSFNASSYVGFILGTGSNTAYLEHNANIGKVPELNAGVQAINVESGGFAAFERTPFDLELDQSSENPGGHVFEKMLSGVYLGTLTLEVLQAMIPEGVFSDSGAAALSIMKDLYIVEIDNLAADNGRDTGVLGTEAFTDADREIMKTVFIGLVDRAALMTAVNILAAVIKTEAGQDPDRPVCVNIDGSTYYYTFGLADKVQAHLQQMLADRGLHIRCVHCDDAPVVGAAIAALNTFD